MTNHLSIVRSPSALHQALSVAAQHQFGNMAHIPIWLCESSVHGNTYRGYDYNSGRWIQVDLDMELLK